MSARPPSISVIIPAYNEQDVIAETVAEAVGVLADLEGQHEILVADDGSRDATWEILQRLAESEPLLRPFRHTQNQGNAAAQRTLIEAARGEVIFYIGADGEWRMAEIPRMLAKLEQGFDLVIGVRVKKEYTLYRKFISFSYNRLVALLWGRNFSDVSSIKMIRAQLWKQVPFHSTSAFSDAERVLIAYRNGARIGTLPVEHRYRRTGRSSFVSPWKSVLALRELLSFWASAHSRYKLPSDWRTRSL